MIKVNLVRDTQINKNIIDSWNFVKKGIYKNIPGITHYLDEASLPTTFYKGLDKFYLDDDLTVKKIIK